MPHEAFKAAENSCFLIIKDSMFLVPNLQSTNHLHFYSALIRHPKIPRQTDDILNCLYKI